MRPHSTHIISLPQHVAPGHSNHQTRFISWFINKKVENIKIKVFCAVNNRCPSILVINIRSRLQRSGSGDTFILPSSLTQLMWPWSLKMQTGVTLEMQQNRSDKSWQSEKYVLLFFWQVNVATDAKSVSEPLHLAPGRAFHATELISHCRR